MIQIKHITKVFPEVAALDDVSLNVHTGEFFGLLGPNGAGKSTLMSLLVGYRDPDAGEVLVHGRTVTQDSLETRRHIGLVPQSLALYDDMSAQENLEIFGSFYHIPRNILRERIKEQLESVQLYDRRKDKVATFSGGMKRRLNLIASLLHDPDILLCDEPTVGVDPQSRNAIFEFLQTLNRSGKPIVYTTHYMEEVEKLCTRMAIIDFGRVIAEGTLDNILQKLPFEESISIAKNATTVKARGALGEAGVLKEKNDHFELKLHTGVPLSHLFTMMESNKISPRFVEIRRPTLEAVFLHLTGRSLRD